MAPASFKIASVSSRRSCLVDVRCRKDSSILLPNNTGKSGIVQRPFVDPARQRGMTWVAMAHPEQDKRVDRKEGEVFDEDIDHSAGLQHTSGDLRAALEYMFRPGNGNPHSGRMQKIATNWKSN